MIHNVYEINYRSSDTYKYIFGYDSDTGTYRWGISQNEATLTIAPPNVNSTISQAQLDKLVELGLIKTITHGKKELAWKHITDNTSGTVYFKVDSDGLYDWTYEDMLDAYGSGKTIILRQMIGEDESVDCNLLYYNGAGCFDFYANCSIWNDYSDIARGFTISTFDYYAFRVYTKDGNTRIANCSHLPE